MRFKNLQKQRYNYFTNASLQYELNSGSVALKLLKYITVYSQSGTGPLSELEGTNYETGQFNWALMANGQGKRKSLKVHEINLRA